MMMRKINVFWLFLFTVLLLLPTELLKGVPVGQTTKPPAQVEDGDKPKKLDIELAYTYKKESLLIGESDLLCSHFISQPLSEDLRIVGSETMEDRKEHSDFDRMYINKGSNDGITEDSVFMVLGKGDKIKSPITGKNLGTYYLRKSLAKIYCLYENNAVITLMKGCQPVQVGDIVIPYKEEDTMFELKLKYLECRLPQGALEGNVVHTSIYTRASRDLSSHGQWVSVDIGKDITAKGEWVLFYRRIKPDLPPIIIGTGVVINAQNTNSTVKVIDSAFEISVGTRLVLLGKNEAGISQSTGTTGAQGNENIPIIKDLDKDKDSSVQELKLNILFDLDGTSIADNYKQELEQIPGFLNDKTQYVIILRGYSCSIGGLEHNLKLSQDRVENVKKYLMDTFKIQPELFETYHYGEKDPPFDNSSEEQRRKNRRVTIEVKAK
jgi:outer membrane protein OmpA-like peptidoglycan-associated protein